jgi:hypothetical protein
MSEHVSDVQLADGTLTQTGKVVMTVSLPADVAEINDVSGMIKSTLLEAAGQSQCTYILGYATDPFDDMDDGGFRARIGCIPCEQEDSICWDTYQKGFCPRLSSCRWCHPKQSDLVTLEVVLEKVGEVAEEMLCPACIATGCFWDNNFRDDGVLMFTVDIGCYEGDQAVAVWDPVLQSMGASSVSEFFCV